jgi:glycosyltransferase involved in cell wall biosynthesis
MIWPEQMLNAEGRSMSSSITCMVLQPQWYQDVKVIKIQRQASEIQKQFVQFLKSIQKDFGFRLIYEVDDVVFHEDIPDYNKFKDSFATSEVRQNCIDMINMCDEVTVTCPFMKELYRERTGKNEITVIPNFPPNFWMGYLYNYDKILRDYEINYRKPRVLYTGSGAHFDVDNKNNGVDDFSHVVDAVRKTISKFQWVFIGSYPPPLRDLVESRQIEFHPWQTLYKYPHLVFNLNPTVTIAPLHDNNFNKSKSDIKFIESSIMGIPSFCQDMCTYSNARYKFKTGDELVDEISKLVRNKQAYKKTIPELRQIGVERFLEHNQNLSCFEDLILYPYGSPNRVHLNRWNS